MEVAAPVVVEVGSSDEVAAVEAQTKEDAVEKKATVSPMALAVMAVKVVPAAAL